MGDAARVGVRRDGRWSLDLEPGILELGAWKVVEGGRPCCAC